MKAFIAAAVLGVLAYAPAAHAQALIDGTNPSAVHEVARGFGSAELTTDGDGDPKITGRMEGIRYSVYFYGCRENKNCRTIQFSASWSAPGKFTLEQINDYNRQKRFGKVYLDKEGDPVIQFDVNLQKGVSQGNLEETFDWWKTIVAEFAKLI